MNRRILTLGIALSTAVFCVACDKSQPEPKVAEAAPAVESNSVSVKADRDCQVALIHYNEVGSAEYGWWDVWHSYKKGGKTFPTPHVYSGLEPGKYVLVVYDPNGKEADGLVVENIEVTTSAKLEYDFKAGDFKDWNCLSCPWLQAWDGTQWVRMYEILKDVVGPARASTHRYEVPSTYVIDGVLTLRVFEEKDEISYIDSLHLEVGGQRLPMQAQPHAERALLSQDGQSLILKKGESVELRIQVDVKALKGQTIELVTHGYYEPSMEMINGVVGDNLLK